MKTSRNTTARVRILELIRQSTIALSQPDIQHTLNGICDRVTIYRVLERLTEDGLIHRIVNVNGVVNYAACNSCAETHQHRHVHFSCRNCHEIRCLDQVVPEFTLPAGFSQEETYFTVSGLCNNCSASQGVSQS